MKFSKKFLQEMVWEESEETEIVKDTIIENSRWSILHEAIFKVGENFYQTSYSVGATEQQDESPFEYDDDEIECIEVEEVLVQKMVWKPVNVS